MFELVSRRRVRGIDLAVSCQIPFVSRDVDVIARPGAVERDVGVFVDRHVRSGIDDRSRHVFDRDPASRFDRIVEPAIVSDRESDRVRPGRRKGVGRGFTTVLSRSVVIHVPVVRADPRTRPRPGRVQLERCSFVDRVITARVGDQQTVIDDANRERRRRRLEGRVRHGQRCGIVAVVVVAVNRRIPEPRRPVAEVPAILLDAVVVRGVGGVELDVVCGPDGQIRSGLGRRWLVRNDADRFVVGKGQRGIVAQTAVLDDVAVDSGVVDRIVVPRSAGPEVAVILAAPPVVGFVPVPVFVVPADGGAAAGSRPVDVGRSAVDAGGLVEEVFTSPTSIGTSHPPPGALARIVTGTHPAGTAELVGNEFVFGLAPDRDQIATKAVVDATRRVVASVGPGNARVGDVLVIVTRIVEIQAATERDRDRSITRGGVRIVVLEGDGPKDRLIFAAVRRPSEGEHARIRIVRTRDPIACGERVVQRQNVAPLEAIVDGNRGSVEFVVVGIGNVDRRIDHSGVTSLQILSVAGTGGNRWPRFYSHVERYRIRISSRVRDAEGHFVCTRRRKPVFDGAPGLVGGREGTGADVPCVARYLQIVRGGTRI